MNKELEIFKEKINKNLIEITSYAWSAEEYTFAEYCILLKRKLNRIIKLVDNRKKENIDEKYIKKMSNYIDLICDLEKDNDEKHYILYQYFHMCLESLVELLR